MAHSLRYILQNVSTGEYMTSTGWSSDVADAKRFTPDDLGPLSPGEYIQYTVYTIT